MDNQITLDYVLNDIERIGKEHTELSHKREVLREECHRRKVPYYEVWASKETSMPTYLTTDKYSFDTFRGVVQIQNLLTNTLHIVEYDYCNKQEQPQLGNAGS